MSSDDEDVSAAIDFLNILKYSQKCSAQLLAAFVYVGQL